MPDINGIPYVESTDLVSAYPAASQALAQEISDQLASKVDYALTANAQSGTGASAYTFVLADASRLTTATGATAKTFTIPPQANVAWVANSIIRVANYGAGDLTIAGGSGVTVTNASKTLAQFESAALVRTGSNAWTLIPFSGGAGNADFSDAATGTYTDGGGIAWKYRDYSSSGTLTITRAGLIQVMIIAGGGGGAGAPVSGSFGGGGGSGGSVSFGTFTNARFAQPLFIATGTYTVTVGSGGAGGTTAPTNGSFGTDSRLGEIYAHRGAPGVPGSSNNTLKGGSGGGGASAGEGITGQGNNGAGLTGGQAGGGGGIGGAASGATEGAGLAMDITGSSVTYGRGGGSVLTLRTPTIGGGGDGYAGFNIAGAAGGNGRVIVRVRTN